MWLGVIIGLLLGAVIESFTGAILLASIGAVVGFVITSKNKATGDVQLQLRDLQERLSEAVHRIAQLERRQTADASATGPVLESTAETASQPAEIEVILEDESLREAMVVPEIAALEQPDVAAVRSSPADEAQPAWRDVRIEQESPPAGARQPTHPNALRPRVEPVAAAVPAWFSEFVARWVVGGNPIVKVGVLILFLGLAFLLRYVTEHTVVPVSLRYAGVAAAGIGLLLFGWRWRKRNDSYGLILQGAGIGVLYLTTFAGMKLHSLIPPELGFLVLVAVVAFAVLLALLQDSLALAVVAALGGFAAPVLASTGSANHLFFFSYLTVINLGIVAVAWFKAWRALNVIGFVSSFLLASAWGKQYYEPSLFSLAEPFLILLFVLYVLVAFLFARRTLADAEQTPSTEGTTGVRALAAQVNYVDASLVFGVPIATFGLQYMLVRSFEFGAALSALAYGLVYVFLAYALFRNAGKRYALLSETMIALAVIFGSLAIPLGLDGKWTSAAWAVEAAGIYWVGVRQKRLLGRLFALLLMFGAAVFFLFELQPGQGIQAIDGSWMACLLLIVSTAVTYRLMRTAPAGCLRDYEESMRPWLIASCSVFVALMPFLIWSVSGASMVLAIVGAVCVALAGRLDERVLTVLGCLFQFVAGLLYLRYHVAVGLFPPADIPAFQYAGFWISLVISLAAFATARLLARREKVWWWGGAVLLWSALWWAFAWTLECSRLLAADSVVLGLLAVTLVTAFLWRWLARRYEWRQLGQATLAYLPVLTLMFFIQMMGPSEHPLIAWGALLWPLALILHALLVSEQKHWLSDQLLKAAHVAGVWLFLIVAMFEIHWHFAALGDPDGAWPMLGWLIAPLAFVWSLSSRKLADKWSHSGPYSEYREAYALSAGMPVVVFVLGWTWLSTLLAEGAAPLPYLPVLNPLEMGQIGVLLGTALWWRSLADHPLFRQTMPLLAAVLGVTALAVISSMVLRACHQWGGVAWEASAMAHSLLAQSALSIVWSILAISLMLLGNRAALRSVWLAGAALVAVVVLKLFLVELAASGSLERIVSFIAVGMLLLLVGYFAPLPPKQSDDTEPQLAKSEAEGRL